MSDPVSDIKIVGLASSKPKAKPNWKIISAIIGIIVLAVGVIAGILLVQQQQNISEKAAVPLCSQGGEECPVAANPIHLRSCYNVQGDGSPDEILCRTSSATVGTVQVCGGQNYCCPSDGAAWTKDLSACGGGGAPTTAPTAPSSSATGVFTDVPNSSYAFDAIQTLYQAGVVSGCSTSPMMYCPDNTLTRAEAAVLLLKAKNGSSYNPPAATGTVFTDVPATHWAAAWVEEFSREGIVAGCGGGLYCIDRAVTRAELSLMLLKTKNGSSYTPPGASGTVFTDVPATLWSAPWIEELSRENVTAGCGTGKFCPDDPVTRAQAAVLVKNLFAITAATTAPIVTTAPIITAAPTTPPVTVSQCSGTCTSNANCATGLTCYTTSGAASGSCRNSQCLADTDCVCGAATAAPTTAPIATATVHATATSQSTSTATVAPTATSTTASGSHATATATTRPTATATTVSGSHATATATTRPTTPTALPIPVTGVEWPTILGGGFGIIMILVSLALAL